MTASVDFNPHPFGKYFLLQSVDLGAYSHTFKAKTYGAKGFEKNLLLQQILPTAQTEAFVKALTEEFKRVVKVSHPNVLPFYDFGCVKEQYFITQEYLEGLSLGQLIHLEGQRLQTLSFAESLYILSEILKGLQAIHTRFKGSNILVHGHIQPQTLFVSRDGEIKITGLGYERLALQFGVSDREDHNYLPETWQRTGVWEVADDLRMCALVLFELMTGFALLTKLPEESGKTLITKEFLQKYFQDALLEFFAKAFSLESQEPFATALDMAVALQRILYSQYPEFSAQQLVKRLQTHFSAVSPVQPDLHKLQNPVFLEDTLKELVRSSRDQINLVHREGTEFSTLLSDTVALSPQDASVFFPETQSIKALLPELVLENAVPAKHISLQNETEFDIEDEESEPESADDLLFGKFALPDALGKTWSVILAAGFFVLILILIMVALRSPDKPRLAGTRSALTGYQLLVTSEPSGAGIWLDGQMNEQMTPATFFTLEKNKTYHIVVKKEGFEDFRTVLKNETGKDQVLDVTLREL